MSAGQLFSSDYLQARKKFLQAAEQAKFQVEHFTNHCCDVNDTELTMDVASCGPRDARKCVVVIAGTHGVEGFAGSAIQVGLMTSGMLAKVKADTKIVLVHALNPYGFAFLRRVNEDNIDLNRNFVDHDQNYPPNVEYTHLAHLIAPSNWSFISNVWCELNIGFYRLTKGRTALQKAVTRGQYTDSEGLFYGGNSPSWSKRTLHQIIDRHLAQAEYVTVIDVHTGLGPFSRGEIIIEHHGDDPAYKRAINWWGKDRVKSTLAGESVSSQLSGTVKLAFTRLLPRAELTAVGLEFGTYPPMKVFRAMRAENWLHHYGGASDVDAARIKKAFTKVFYPDDGSWKDRVWEQGALVVQQTLQGVNALND